MRGDPGPQGRNPDDGTGTSEILEESDEIAVHVEIAVNLSSLASHT